MGNGDCVEIVPWHRDQKWRFSFTFGVQTGAMLMMDCFLALFKASGVTIFFSDRLMVLIALSAILLHIGFAIMAVIAVTEAITHRRRTATS